MTKIVQMSDYNLYSLWFLRSIPPPRPAITEPASKKMKYDQTVHQPQDFNESMHPGLR